MIQPDEAFLLIIASQAGCFSCEVPHEPNSYIYTKVDDLVENLKKMVNSDKFLPLSLYIFDAFTGEILEDLKLQTHVTCTRGFLSLGFKFNGLTYRIKKDEN